MGTASNEGTLVVVAQRQFVLGLALLAAASLLGGTAARAGYVPVAAVTEDDALGSLTLLPERETPPVFVGSSAASRPQSNTDGPSVPSGPLSPLGKVLPDACNFGHGCGAGSSSSSAPGNGASAPPYSNVPRPLVPQLELAAILPPITGDTHTFSVASFLFRPPRDV